MAAEPTSRRLVVDPPYALRDTAGRGALLDELTGLVVALEDSAQVWHGPQPVHVDESGRSAAAVLTCELARAARVRQSLVLPTADSEASLDAELPHWPAVHGEGSTQVQLADGGCGRVLALTRWPAVVTPGWLAEVAGGCAAVVLHLQPVPRDVASRLLRRRLASLTSTAVVEEQAGRLLSPEVELAADAARALRTDLAVGSTRLVRVQLLFALLAGDEEALLVADARLRAQLGAHLAAADTLRYQQQPAWAACAPGGAALRWPWRLLDAASAAASIPLPVGPTGCDRGVLAGRDALSGAPVLLDRFAASNPTRLVVGTSGAGKSYAAKLELLRQLARGVQAVVVDPEGEFGALAQVTGGLCLAVGDEPAGLDPVGLATRPSLAASEGLAVLASWAAALLGTTLSSVDLALLDRALGVLRADRTAAGSALVGPSAGDLLAVVAELSAFPPFTGADLAARLAPAAGGTLAALFAPNPDLAHPPALVVFDLRSVPDRARPAVMSCVLSWAWSQTVGAQVAHQRLVVIDEAHLLLDDPPAAQLLAQLARRARKYGVALEVVTQRLSDFLAHPAGQAVLANAATKLLLGCEDHERAAIVAGLGLTDTEARLLRPGQRGAGLLVSAGLRTPVQIVAAAAEHALAATGPR